jgi:sigma-54 dependent transcriptional regulator, acetoin dehydrogenase operon transcriptional activator AcoR
MDEPSTCQILELRVPDRTSWERFFLGGVMPDEALCKSWRRSVDFGVSPNSQAFPEGVSGVALGERRSQNESLFLEGRSVLDPLASQLASRGLLALVADADGVILMARGGGALEPKVTRSRLAEGMCWAEQVRGTNAIGTTLADGRAVAVVGYAHFEAMNHGLFCYAAPILDEHGEIRAVFDVTGSLEQDDPKLGVIVQAAATALSRVLRLQAYTSATGGYQALHRILSRSTTPAILLEAPGVVRTVNSLAAALLNRSSAFLEGLHCEALFTISWSHLCNIATEKVSDKLVFETKHASFNVELEPVKGPDGRAFAVLAFLSPRVGFAANLSGSTRKRASPKDNQTPVAFDNILGSDPAILRAKATATALAVTSLPVLLLAETGTGKELFAKAIHLASNSQAGPFVALNCGAFAPTLLESELFGYAPGAFTGAARNGQQGKIASAINGTLFLDEVAELSPSTQAMLLRVLEDGTFQRLGESRTSHADFRLICSTCRDLPSMVRAGTFRQDLFFRIQGACIRLPPLRMRADLLELANALLAQLAAKAKTPIPSLAKDAIEYLQAHQWPGNVRELKMALVHALALTPLGAEIHREHLPVSLLSEEPPTQRAPLEQPASSKEEALQRALTQALAESKGNYAAAARKLGVARSTVYRMLKRIGTEPH